MGRHPDLAAAQPRDAALRAVPAAAAVHHRTTAPDRSDELTYAIADLYRLDGVRRIDLPGLSANEVAQYLSGRSPVRRARGIRHPAA